MRRVRLVGGDGVLGHVLGRHMHMEGHVPDEDCQGSRWPRVQRARSGKGHYNYFVSEVILRIIFLFKLPAQPH